MLQTLGTAFYIFLPAGIANATPVLAAKIPILKPLEIPIDAGRSFRGVRIFGDHKTLRGFVTGILAGIITCSFQAYVWHHSPFLQNFLLFDYADTNPVLMGTLLSFGALAGDAAKSFFKRRTHIKPGQTWFPFDQIDYIIGAWLASQWYLRLPPTLWLTILVLYFSLHIGSTIVGYATHLKSSPL